jgi:hypothetical protein
MYRLSELDPQILAPLFQPPNVLITDDGHWLWQGEVDDNGYGILMGRRAHRVSHAALRGGW